MPPVNGAGRIERHVLLGHRDADAIITMLMAQDFIREQLRFEGPIELRLIPQGTEYRLSNGKVIRPRPDGYYTMVNFVAYWFCDCGGPDSKLDHHDGKDPSAAAKFNRLTRNMFTHPQSPLGDYRDVVNLATLSDTGELHSRWATLAGAILGMEDSSDDEVLQFARTYVDSIRANTRRQNQAALVRPLVVSQIKRPSNTAEPLILVEVLPNGRRIGLIVTPDNLASPLRRTAAKAKVDVALSVVIDKGHFGILACGIRDLREVPGLIASVRKTEARLRGQDLTDEEAEALQMVGVWFAHLVTPTKGGNPYVPHLLNGSRTSPIPQDRPDLRTKIRLDPAIQLLRDCVGAMEAPGKAAVAQPAETEAEDGLAEGPAEVAEEVSAE
ncbi:hypothetical protein HGA91_03290 [candidate division WWE3 bacterium]|nr:hypothetical protein [candidate division WWE3 bacterium]